MIGILMGAELRSRVATPQTPLMRCLAGRDAFSSCSIELETRYQPAITVYGI
jgi:hypothetical protein